MSAVGRGEMRAADVARAMYPDYKEERAAALAQQPKPESGWFGLSAPKAGQVKLPPRRAARSRSAASTPTCRFASPDRGARAGRSASGILQSGRGHHIYPIQSPALKDFEDTPERWLDLRGRGRADTPSGFRPASRCRP